MAIYQNQKLPTDSAEEPRYSTYSKWINKEIEISKSDYNKPIIAVEPWASEKTSQIVKDNADAIVKWQSKSIVDAIRNHAI